MTDVDRKTKTKNIVVGPKMSTALQGLSLTEREIAKTNSVKDIAWPVSPY